MKKRITAHISIFAVTAISLIVGIVKGLNFNMEESYSSGIFGLSFILALLCAVACIVMDFYASIKDGSIEEWKDLLFLFERYERNDKNKYIYDMYCNTFSKKRPPVTKIGKINAAYKNQNPFGSFSYFDAWMPYIEIVGVALVAFAWSFGIQNIMMYWIASSPLYAMFWISIAILAVGLLVRWMFSEDPGTDINIMCAIVNGVVVVGLAIALSITGIVRHSNVKNYERYSADNIIITVEEKMDATINSSYSNGYVSAFKIKIKNNSTLAVYNIVGEMIIYNAEGKVIDTGNCTFKCNLSGGDEGSFVLNIDRKSSDEALELYYSSIDDLRITFRLTEVIYENYERKEYSVDAKTILELKLSEGGESTTEVQYQNALTLFNQGDYGEARTIFGELGRYKESYEYFRNCEYQIALDLYSQGFYKEAVDKLNTLGNYNNSNSKIQEICDAVLSMAEEYGNEGQYSNAYNLCNQILQYEEHELYYAYKAASTGDYKAAITLGLTTIVLPEGITEIPDGMFEHVSGLKKIIIPSGVTAIGNGAFFQCHSLEEVVIPNTVTFIEASAFSRCEKIKEIKLPDCLQTLGNSAFSYCTALEIVTIGSNLEKNSDVVFNSYTSSGGVRLSSCLDSIGNYTFYGCSALKTINIPKTVTNIGEEAFNHCYSLESISIPNSVSNIETKAFYNCVSLKNVNFEKGGQVLELGEYVFRNSGLESIELPGTIKTISQGAFYECENLKTVTLESGIEAIGLEAFANCSSLENVILSDTLELIYGYAFYGCKIEQLTMPATLVAIGAYAFQFNNLSSVVFENTIGWITTHYNYNTWSYEVNVENPERNAYLLRDGYVADTWTCENDE